MKAFLLNSQEDFKTMELGKKPRPECGENDVLIRISHASLNPADRFLAQKLYPAKPTFPHILGRDSAGTVEQVGAKVTQFKTGDRVCTFRGDIGINRDGTLAEYIAAPQEYVIEAPKGWTDEECAAYPLVYQTAHMCLKQWHDLPDNPTVLIAGVSGGVGLACLQMATGLGMNVIGLTRSKEKAEKLEAFGLKHALDPSDKNFPNQVRELTNGKGADLAVDTVAGSLLPKLVASMAPHGRISCVGMAGGAVENFNTATLFFNRIRLGGVILYDYSEQEARTAFNECAAALDAAEQRPLVDSIYPIAETVEAFKKLDASHFGKIVVKVN